ncbi:MAG: pyrroloquinoline quinone biosynthesis peptide chaperone PqqD [Proteobacteria bacterium]|nr:pyrroloquinoline quinone biosynthesis peptide chaperone PqqD [Pseudomonadota bacterium]MDA1331385.1 pyrroloquinoline quinone biosynthesis peptide chaperone PqqD [Pseudomonadota bacterium]
MSENPLVRDKRLSLQKQFRFQWEATQESFVLLYPEGLIKLPGSSGEIMKLIDGSKSVDMIITHLEEQFPGIDLKNDVLDFLEHAYEKNWIRTN